MEVMRAQENKSECSRLKIERLCTGKTAGERKRNSSKLTLVSSKKMIEKAKWDLNKGFPTLGNREGRREAAGQLDTGVTRMDRHPAVAEENAGHTPGTEQHLNARGHCSSPCFPAHWGTQAATHSKDFQPQFDLRCSNVPMYAQGQLTD